MSLRDVLPFTLKFEGGYANNPEDPGGETFRGISRKANPSWEGWVIIDQIKREISGDIDWKLIDRYAERGSPELTELVRDLYDKEYYQRVAAFGLAEMVTDKLFDINVNLSPKNANKILQRAINSISRAQVKVDGVVGPATLTAAKELEAVKLTRAIARAQERFYLDNTIPRFPNAKQAFLDRARWLPEGAIG